MMPNTFLSRSKDNNDAMLQRLLTRDRALAGIAVTGALTVLVYLVGMLSAAPVDRGAGRMEQLLTVDPWYCEVLDPSARDLVSHSVETFHEGGRLEGRTRLEDRSAGRVLLEFSYDGVWQFDDPWLTEAINDYRYLHVDDTAFSAAELAAIEAEFGEPEVSRVHALTEGQLVYGDGMQRSLYQCHRRPAGDRA